MVTETRLVTSVVLPLPIRETWPWFREPELIREWHGWEYESDGGLDAEIRQIYVEGATVGEDHRSISFGTHLFTFSEDDGRTRLEVVRCPIEEGTAEAEWEPFLPDIDEGWACFLEQLRFKLERHPDDPRRTLYFGGVPKDPTISPIQWLGLGQVGLQRVGAAYGATVGPGDALVGTVWFNARHLLGVTVDDWGDGLLVVGDGSRGGPPYTRGQAILTTFGLDDGRRAEIDERWGAWWSRHYDGG